MVWYELLIILNSPMKLLAPSSPCRPEMQIHYSCTSFHFPRYFEFIEKWTGFTESAFMGSIALFIIPWSFFSHGCKIVWLASILSFASLFLSRRILVQYILIVLFCRGEVDALYIRVIWCMVCSRALSFSNGLHVSLDAGWGEMWRLEFFVVIGRWLVPFVHKSYILVKVKSSVGLLRMF